MLNTPPNSHREIDRRSTWWTRETVGEAPLPTHPRPDPIQVATTHGESVLPANIGGQGFAVRKSPKEEIPQGRLLRETYSAKGGMGERPGLEGKARFY